jgi:hypothetical protein
MQLSRHPDGFAERQVRMDRFADISCVRAHFDGETDFADQVAGIQTHDAATNHPMRFLVEQELREAFVTAIGNSARPEAAHGNTALPYLMPSAFNWSSVLPAQATTGSV